MRIKVLLADSNDATRRAIRNLLEQQAEIELMAEATNFAQTIQLTKTWSRKSSLWTYICRTNLRSLPQTSNLL
jgi:DNA-binding NarL/FixJ family response regulator